MICGDLGREFLISSENKDKLVRGYGELNILYVL